MTTQQKLLWEKLTNEVRESGMDNLHARELYDEMCKLLNMSDKVLISISEKEEGIEVRISEGAYDNLAVIGLLEKIKMNLINGVPEKLEKSNETKISLKQKYDA
jgi:hypothetical protein